MGKLRFFFSQNTNRCNIRIYFCGFYFHGLMIYFVYYGMAWILFIRMRFGVVTLLQTKFIPIILLCGGENFAAQQNSAVTNEKKE